MATTTVMPSLGACYLHLYGGPIDGMRWEVPRDTPDTWEPVLRLGSNIGPLRYALVRTPTAVYYRYDAEATHEAQAADGN